MSTSRSFKPSILIIYTGGTIGMVQRPETGTLGSVKFNKILDEVPELNKFGYNIETLVLNPVMDSSNMSPDIWVKIAKSIEKHYNEFDGFVILHGTDTMTYTAAALSFILENLNKPVVITGSQVPIAYARNDAIQNLISALMFAAPYTFGIPVIPEVSIFFNNKLLRGNRAKKINCDGYAGFDSYNYPYLSVADKDIVVNKAVIQKLSDKDFCIYQNFEKNVFLFDIFPGITSETLRHIFNIPDLKGVVLKTYGAGTASTDNNFLKEIKLAVEKNIIIVNVTQCIKGRVNMKLYDSGAKLLRRGVISGADMTPQSALVKLMFLMGRGYHIDKTKELMQKNLRGEITV